MLLLDQFEPKLKIIRFEGSDARSRRVFLRRDGNKSAKNRARIAKNRRLFVRLRKFPLLAAAKNRDVGKTVATVKRVVSLFYPNSRFRRLKTFRRRLERAQRPTLQTDDVPPLSLANNDAKTGAKLRASRRDLRTFGAATKQNRFSTMILTF